MNRRTGTAPILSHSEEMTLPDGRTLSEGDEFTLEGGGRYRFLYQYLRDGSVTAHGPIDSPTAKLRSFRPERVRTVHRKKLGRP